MKKSATKTPKKTNKPASFDSPMRGCVGSRRPRWIRISAISVRRCPYVPTRIEPAEVRTLADLGLTPARAWALTFHGGNLAPEIYGLDVVRRRGRVLHEEFRFAVLVVTDGDGDAVNTGDVYGYEQTLSRDGTYREVVRSIGQLESGRFFDAIEVSARSYAQSREVA